MTNIKQKFFSTLFLILYIFSINISFLWFTYTRAQALGTDIPYEYFKQDSWDSLWTWLSPKTSDTMYSSNDSCVNIWTTLSATSPTASWCTIISRVIDFWEKKEFLWTFIDGNKFTDNGWETNRNYFLFVRTWNNTNVDDSASWSSWHIIWNDFFSNLQNTRYLQYKIQFMKSWKTINSFEIKYRKFTASFENVGDKTWFSAWKWNIVEPAKLFEYNLWGQLNYSDHIFANSLNYWEFKFRDQVFMLLWWKIVVKNPKTNDLLWTTDVYWISEIIWIYDLLWNWHPYIVTTTNWPTSVAIFDALGWKNPVWQYVYNAESYWINYNNVYVSDLDWDNILDLVATWQYHFRLDIFNFATWFKSNPFDNLKSSPSPPFVPHHPIMMIWNLVSKTEKSIYLVDSVWTNKSSLVDKNWVSVPNSTYLMPSTDAWWWPGRWNYFFYDKKNEPNSIKWVIRIWEPYYSSPNIVNYIYDITGQATVENLYTLGTPAYVPSSFEWKFSWNGLNIMPYSYFTGSTWKTSFFDLWTNPWKSILTWSTLAWERIIATNDLNNDGIMDFVTMSDTNINKNSFWVLNFYEVLNSPVFSYTKKLSTTTEYNPLLTPIRKNGNSIRDPQWMFSVEWKIILRSKLPDDKSELWFFIYNGWVLSNTYSRTFDYNLKPTIIWFSKNIESSWDTHVAIWYKDSKVELINVTKDTPTLDYLFTTWWFSNSFPLVTNISWKNIICLPNAITNIDCIDWTNAKLSFPPAVVSSIKNTGYNNTRVALWDIDNDNKPEIWYTTYDGNNYYANITTISDSWTLINLKTKNLWIYGQRFWIDFWNYYSHNKVNKYDKDIYSIDNDQYNYSVFNKDLSKIYSISQHSVWSNHWLLDVYNFDEKWSWYSSIINQYYGAYNWYNGTMLYAPWLDNWQRMSMKSWFASNGIHNTILYTWWNGWNYWLWNGINWWWLISRWSEYSLKHMQTWLFSSAAAKTTNSNLWHILAVWTADWQVTFNYTFSGTTELANVFNFWPDVSGWSWFINQRIKFINWKTYSIYLKTWSGWIAWDINNWPFLYTNLNNPLDTIDTSTDLNNYNTSVSVKAAADIDWDGKIEFVITDWKWYLYVVSSTTWKVIWSYNEGFYIKHLILADVNNDWYLNIIYVTSEWKLVAIWNRSLLPPTYVYDWYSEWEDANLAPVQWIIGWNWWEVYWATGYNYKIVIQSWLSTVDYIDWKNTTNTYFCLVWTNYVGTPPTWCVSIPQSILYSTQTTYKIQIQAYNNSWVSDIKISDGFSYGTIDISKFVKWPKDTVYKTSTEIAPWSMVTYKIIIKNNWDNDIGWLWINKLVVYDYMPKTAYYVPNSTRVLKLWLTNPSITDDILVTQWSTLKTDKWAILIWKMPDNIIIQKGKDIEVLFNAKFD